MAFFSDRTSSIPETIDDNGKISPATYRQPRPLTASAIKVDLKDTKEVERMKKRLDNTKWQSEAWDYYDYIGEVKFVANLVANVISRINLYVAYNEDSARIPTPIKSAEPASEFSHTAEEILHLLESGDGGTSGLLRDAALSLFIAGEFYLVREPGDLLKGIPEKWNIRSVNEIVVTEAGSGKNKKKTIYLKSSRNEDKEDWIALPEGSFISRMWRRHPRFSKEADSSLLGILEDCDDLLVFSREGRQASRSRANAGLLYLPSELEDSGIPEGEDDEGHEFTDEAHETLVDQITEALIGPATSDDHANSVVPLIFRGPAAHASDIKYIQLNRPSDQMYQQLIDSKLERILSSLDIPKDIAKGLSSVKYSNGIVIEESLYKSHVEPLILLIVDQLTNGFLRPSLRHQGVPEDVVSRTVVWYDPQAIAAKPSKAEAANFGVQHDLISGSSWRAANGYGESDAPDQEEQALKLLKSKMVLDPAIAKVMMEKLFPEILATTRNEHLTDSTPSDANALNDALGLTPTEEAPSQQFPDGIVQDADPAPGKEAQTMPQVQSDIPLIEP